MKANKYRTELKMKKLKTIFTERWLGYTATAVIAVLLYEMLEHLDRLKPAFSGIWSFISPIHIGIAIAYLFDPVADDFFERKLLRKIKKENTRHLLGIILTIICILLIIALLLVALIPSVTQSISKMVSNWDVYTQKVQTLLKKGAEFAKSHNINIDTAAAENLLENSAGKLMETVKNNSKAIISKLGEIGSGVSNFAIGVVFGFCFLGAKKTLLGFLDSIRRALYTKETIERNNALLTRCHKIFARYIGCTLLDALIVGTAMLIFMLIMGMPYAPLISVIVAFTNIIPTFGPMIGAVIGIFFLILDNPIQALWFFIFSCILQAIDGAVIKPRLFSNSLGIPAVWTLVLIILGGKIAGMLGIILAIPFAAIFAIVYKETIEPRLKQRADKVNSAAHAEKEAEDTTGEADSGTDENKISAE